jgi:hypothetical protein
MLGVGSIGFLSTGYSGSDAAKLTMDGGASEVIAYKDVTVRAAEQLNFFGAAKDGGSPAYVRIRNRQTGKWLKGSDSSWTTGQEYVVKSTAGAWNTASVQFNVESLETLKNDTTLLRVYLHAADSSSGFDQIELWPSVNWCSVHGHNIPPCVIPTWQYSNATSSWTTQAQMTLRRDSFYATTSSGLQAHRYWRMLLDGIPDTTSYMFMGEYVLGQYYELLQNPSYGGSVSWTDRQTRLDGDLGDAFIYLHNQQPQRKLTLNFVFPGSSEYDQFKDEVFRGSRGGGNLICVAPTDYDPSIVILGRIREVADIVKNTPGEWTANLEVVEAPLPNAPERAYVYDAPVTAAT